MKIKRISIIFYLIILFLSFSSLYKPTTIYAFDAEELKNNENANLLWDYIISTGGTEFWAAAAIGNAYAELSLSTDLTPNEGGYFGAFQFDNGDKKDGVTKLKGWCSKNNLDCNSITAQYEYLIKEYRKSCCKTLTGLSPEEIHKDTTLIVDCKSAAAYFALGMEGCKCYKGTTYGEGKIIDKAHREDGTLCDSYEFPKSTYGPKICLQNLVGRIKNTEIAYTAFSGKQVQSYSGENPATAQSSPLGTAGLITEEELAKELKLVEAYWENKLNTEATRDKLSVQELEQLSDWELMSKQDDNTVISFLRRIVAVLGILLVLWGLFLYLAYWFDTINTLIPFQLVPILSFGKLEVLNEEETTFSLAGERDKTKRVTVNHKNIITVCVLLILAGVFILSGFIYTIIGALYHKAKSFYY